MELTVAGGLPATPALPTPDQAPAPGRAAHRLPGRRRAARLAAAAVAAEPWPGQQCPSNGRPAAVAPAGPPQPGRRSSCRRSSRPAGGRPRARPGRGTRRVRHAGGAGRQAQVRACRAVDLVFGLSMLVAVGGVAFAVGRATAPPSTASTAHAPDWVASRAARPGDTATTGTGTGTGKGPGRARRARSGQNAVVLPQASGPRTPSVSRRRPAAHRSSQCGAGPGTQGRRHRDGHRHGHRRRRTARSPGWLRSREAA